MAVQKQDDQHEHTFSSYVRIRDVVLKTYLGRWTIGRSGERGSGISVLPARYDHDDCDGKLTKIPKRDFIFRTCEDGAGWHLIPCRISPRSEFFSQAYKNWHIMWGINLGLNWISHCPHTHQVAFLPPLDNGRYGPLGWDLIILYCSSRQLWFPVWYFKGIYRTILSKIT